MNATCVSTTLGLAPWNNSTIIQNDMPGKEHPMSTAFYLNLPVKDLAVSRSFYGALGFAFDERFADENMDAVVISDTLSVLLLVEPYFATFTTKQVADAGTSAQALFAIGMESRERVDELLDRALTAGGQPAGEDRDLDFLYGRGFTDPDGHQWDIIHVPAAG
ncbi:VOC family protein [Nonomuraea sp. NPDC050451]|uniref:VOC family protein n=1 Tax=Nonomuraea sp. NPDC050451 TaxID=3364364 RepID=UPI0037B104F0